MNDQTILQSLERANRALDRIDRALAQQGDGAHREQELRAKVREVVEELDGLIRQAAV